MEERKIILKVRAVVLHEGKLLAVRHSHDASFVALPGGHLEWGEDIKECLSREMIEELGVKPEIGRLFYINTFIQVDNNQCVEFFFEVKNGGDYLDTEKISRSHAHEITDIVWISPAENAHILPKAFAEDFKAGKLVSDEVRFIKD